VIRVENDEDDEGFTVSVIDAGTVGLLNKFIALRCDVELDKSSVT